ncbi:MAG: glycosyltransferase family 39 protein, partial [Chloroflexota bacterium]
MKFLQFISRYKLPLVLAVALIIRVGILFAFPSIFNFEQTGAVHGSDAYDSYAQNLLATGVYGRVPGEPDAWIPPGYSYALMPVYALFGRGGVQVGLFNTALDLVTITLLYYIGVNLFGTANRERGKWIGAGAGLFYAGYPYLVFQNLTLIDTPLFMLLLYAFILLMILLRKPDPLDARTWGLAAAGGFVLGLTMMVRPIVPPLALLVAVWFLFRRSLLQTVIRLLPVAMIGMVVVLGWTVRNYSVYGTFVPLTTTSGANFWQGNSEYTIPYFRAGYDVQWTAPELQTEDLTSREADAERFELAVDYLRENTDEIPELLWVKFLIHWSIDVAPRRNPTAGELPRLEYVGDARVLSTADENLELGDLPEGDPVDAYSQPLFDTVGRQIHRYYYGGLFLLSLAGAIIAAREWRYVSLLWFT